MMLTAKAKEILSFISKATKENPLIISAPVVRTYYEYVPEAESRVAKVQRGNAVAYLGNERLEASSDVCVEVFNYIREHDRDAQGLEFDETVKHNYYCGLKFAGRNFLDAYVIQGVR